MRKPGVRNVTFILLAFLFVGGLVLVARMRPSVRVMPPESPEIQELRLCRDRNALFELDAASKMIPHAPHGAYEAPFHTGPIGMLTRFYITDDSPRHAVWVRDCGPALERARGVLEIEHLLLPVRQDNAGSADTIHRDSASLLCGEYMHSYGLYRLFSLPRLMLATAGLEAAEGTDSESVLSWFKDGLRLSLKLHNAIPAHMIRIQPKPDLEPEPVCLLVRQFDEHTQHRALQWLIDFNASRPPPRRAVEDELRMVEADGYPWPRLLSRRDPKRALYLLQSGSERRVFASNLDAIIDACCLNSQLEFEEWSLEFPELARAARESFFRFDPLDSVLRNANFQQTLDATQTVLAIEVFRHRHGHYPLALEELAPEVLPEDAADAFFYQPAETHYWLAWAKNIRDPARLTVLNTLVAPPDVQRYSDSMH